MMKIAERYEIREGFASMDFVRVTAWLAASYWSPGIAREMVERGAHNSALVIGSFLPGGEQIGFARVVSDCTRFAYLADVIVDEAQRGQGIGRAMVRFALAHPVFSTVCRWTLTTKDAHGVYAPLGFLPLTDEDNHPERWMVRHVEPRLKETILG